MIKYRSDNCLRRNLNFKRFLIEVEKTRFLIFSCCYNSNYVVNMY